MNNELEDINIDVNDTTRPIGFGCFGRPFFRGF